MDLLEITLLIKELEEEQHKLEVMYETDKAALKKKLTEAENIKAILVSNFDYDKIHLVRERVNFTGIYKWWGVGETASTLAACIRDVANGCSFIRTKYFGCKNYDRWTCQDSCHTYGMGPSHGTIVFSIGLNHKFRQELDAGAIIDSDFINAFLYVLHNIRENEKFREVVFGG